MTDRAHCPGCGIPTVADHETLTAEEALCEVCYRQHRLQELRTINPPQDSDDWCELRQLEEEDSQ